MSRLLIITSLCVLLLACAASEDRTESSSSPERSRSTMELGNFSVSLSVKDLATSRAFYEKMGFAVIAGAAEQNYLILANGGTKIGLFQGMFEGNILTFNPGWDGKGEALPEFTDVREIQRRLKDAGLSFATEADESSSGPASCVLTDPDGNVILLDQHVPKP